MSLAGLTLRKSVGDERPPGPLMSTIHVTSKGLPLPPPISITSVYVKPLRRPDTLFASVFVFLFHFKCVECGVGPVSASGGGVVGMRCNVSPVQPFEHGPLFVLSWLLGMKDDQDK